MSEQPLHAPDEIAASIFRWVGESANIKTVSACMTRVRVVVKNTSLVQVPYADHQPVWLLGMQQQDHEFQFVVGPNLADIVAQKMQSFWSISGPTTTTAEPSSASQPLSAGAGLFSKIFIPLVPGFIGAGLFLGLSRAFEFPIFGKVVANTFPSAVKLLALLGNGFMEYLPFITSLSAARVFGASPVFAALVIAAMWHPDLANLTLLGISGQPKRGGIIAVLMVTYLLSHIEKWARRLIKPLYSLWLVPICTCLLTGMAAICIIQPLSGWFEMWLNWLIQNALNRGAGAIFGAAMAASFLPLVLTGLHQILAPLQATLLRSAEAQNPLITILSMAGMSQVGVSLYILATTQSQRLKRVIYSGLLPGVLGIGEPLLFGVLLPLKRPLIAACAGAAVAGGLVAHLKLASYAVGLSGLPLALTIADHRGLAFLCSLFVSAVSGFIAALCVGYQDEPPITTTSPTML